MAIEAVGRPERGFRARQLCLEAKSKTIERCLEILLQALVAPDEIDRYAAVD